MAGVATLTSTARICSCSTSWPYLAEVLDTLAATVVDVEQRWLNNSP